MSTLYLIRHGQASFGHENYDQLSETGHLQARVLASHFLALNLEFDLMYIGTLQRHRETAQAFIDACRTAGRPVPEIREAGGLNEYDSEGVLKGVIPLMLAENPAFETEVNRMFQDKRAFQLVFEAVMARWVSGVDRAPDLPNWQSFAAGVDAVIQDIMQTEGRGNQIAVFTSGGPIAVAVKKALNLTDLDALKISWQVVNGSVSRFKCTSDRFMLATFNEYTHLELDGGRLVTYR